MKLSTSIESGWQAIHADGQIDSKSVTSLRDYIDSELKDDMPVALDLSDVTFMSSAGFRALLMLHRQTQEMKVSLALVGLSEEIADTMKITGFYDYFQIYGQISELPGVGE